MNKKIIISLIITAVLSFCLVSCSSNTINVSINDAMTQSIVSVKSGATVKQAIDEAEIMVGEKDEISPSADTALKDGDVITISRYADVTIEYGDKCESLSLVGGTVADAIEKAGIKLSKNYSVNYDKAVFLTDGMKIVITKLVDITLTVDGKTEVIQSPTCTVNEFLNTQGIELGKEDTVTPSLTTELTADTNVVVKRVVIKTVTMTETIKYNTVYKTSSSMKSGTSKVTQQGKNGEKKVKYKIVYVDGKESEKTVLEETVIQKPVDKIVTQGKKESAKPGKTIVSKQRVDDCDGSGHGYFVITWSDGTVTYEVY